MTDINPISPTTAAVFIPEVWSADILRATEANLVFATKVKRYDSDVSKFGDIIHIPNLSNLTANNKVVGDSVTPQYPTESEKTITINLHKEASFYIDDVAKVQSKYDLMGEYTSKAGYAIAKAIDTSVAGLYAGLTQYVGDGSTDVTDANIITAIKYLDEADAPESDRFFVINPAAKADLMAIDKFVLRTGPGWSTDNSPILHGAKENGFWGDIYGVKVYVSTNVVTESASPNVVHNLLFHKEAFGLAIQLNPRTQSDYELKYLAHLVVCDVLYGLSELRDDFAVDFRTAA